MRQHDELRFDDEVMVPWGVGEVHGKVQEIYGDPPRRYVVVRLSPELSSYVVAEETTVTLPYDAVRRADVATGNYQ